MRYLTIILLFISSLAMAQRPYLFPTIADAASNTYIGVGAYVQTQGYSASGDGGGALYRMTAIASAPMAADSGYVYPVTATKVLVQVLPDEFLNTATYGVVCGSSAEATNNYNRLQRFFNAIDTLDKQAFVNGCNDTIYVNFTSALTTTLTSHDKFVMRGEGADVTRIKATTGSIDFGFSDAAKVNLFDLYLDGYDATAFGGIGGADQSLTYVNDTLTISGGNFVVITGGGGGTDDQTISIDSNAFKYTLSIEDGNSVTFAKVTDTDTDDQTLTLDSVSGTYNLTIEGGNTVKIKRDTDTDDQTLSLVTNTLSISEGNSVDLSAYLDNTDDQVISIDSNATTYTLTLESGGSIKILKSVNTDAQTLSFSNPNLSISGGNSVDISAIDTDTDDQTLSIDSNATTYTLTIVDGNNVKFAKGGGSGTPGGTHNDLQINRSGSFTGTDSLEWVGATGYLKVLGRIDQTYGVTSTALGFGALDADDGTSNTNVAVGYEALTTLTTASAVTALGYRALRLNNANGNTALGYRALENFIGSQSVAIGYDAAQAYNTASFRNLFAGYQVCATATGGSDNVVIGNRAATNNSTGGGVTSIDNSIIIGSNSKPFDATPVNEIVIGYALNGNGDNTVTIGNSSVTDTHLGGTVHSTGAYIGKVTTFNTASGQTTYGDYICLVDYTTTGIATLTIDTDNLVNGYTLIIKDMDGNAGANTITIATEGAETIDGAASITITTNYGAVRLFSDGVNWYTY